ncbi:MAG: toxin-antitoxin system TumE family protein [Rhodanobacter sp.]
MEAELITRFKDVTPEGGVIELVVWRVPQPVPPSTHEYKYRAAYAVNGVRIVGFDNERGKGDHMHLDGQELPYQFTSLEQLIDDFISEVDKRRKAL